MVKRKARSAATAAGSEGEGDDVEVEPLCVPAAPQQRQVASGTAEVEEQQVRGWAWLGKPLPGRDSFLVV